MKLIDRIPKSYRELNYKAYVSIMNTIPDKRPEGSDLTTWSALVHLTTLAILSNLTPAEIENLPASEVFAAIQATAYLEHPIEPRKTDFKVKDINELTFDEFTTYQALRLDQWNNLGKIIGIMVKGMTPVQVDALSIDDAMQIFFLSSKKTNKFLIRSRYYLVMKLIIWKVRSLVRWSWRKNSTPNDLQNNGVGSI